MDCPVFEFARHEACRKITRIENLDEAMCNCTGGQFRQCVYFWIQLTEIRADRVQRQRAPERASAT